MQQRLSFYDEIARNKRQSFFLLVAILAVLLALVYSISFFFARSYFFIVLIFGIIFSLFYVVGGYYKSAELALSAANARPAPRVQFRRYHDLVEGLCLASGLPKPKLYVIDDSSINAFASGRDPKRAVIAVTTGALEKLDKRELEGVLAHELSHIANYDIRFMTLAAVLVGMIAILSEIFLRSLFWSSFSEGDSRNNKSGSILMIVGLILAIIAPIIVALVQLAISRKREYAADSSAVKFMRTPTGLIGALKKIKGNKAMKVSGAVAPLFIANPLKSAELFSTHPPLDERIKHLERM